MLPSAASEIWEKVVPIFNAYRSENLVTDPGEVIYRFNKIFYKNYMEETFDNQQVSRRRYR